MNGDDSYEADSLSALHAILSLTHSFSPQVDRREVEGIRAKLIHTCDGTVDNSIHAHRVA
jgi:hypothetical protein